MDFRCGFHRWSKRRAIEYRHLPHIAAVRVQDTPSRYQSGVSLIELMLGITISMILLAGILTVSLRISASTSASVADTRLNQEVREVLNLMTRELQRAGYVAWYETWDDDDGDGDPVDSNDANTQSATLADLNGDGGANLLDYYIAATPAMDRMGEITLWSFPSPGVAGTPSACTTNCDCILYSFDLNKDGAQGVGSGTPGSGQNSENVEQFGLRWNDNEVQMRTGGNTYSCNSGTWEALTDDSISITNLGFSLVYADSVATGNDSTVYQFDQDGVFTMATTCTAAVSGDYPGDDATADTLCYWRRKVDISIQGKNASNSNVTLTMNTDVKLRNDHLDSM